VSWLLAAPILIPFATAIVVFLAPMRWLGVAGVLALLAASISLVVEVASRGVIATQIAGWPAPFGITLVADHLSAFMVVITAILGLAAAIYALPELERPQRAGGFDPLFQILLGGMCGAFLAGDLFNLYVWFEVMLIASFALLVLGGRARQLDAAVKYATLNLFSTALMLAGVGLLYGLTGTLNMADLHLQVREIDNPGLLSARRWDAWTSP
jgi:multicomponent Na+:H+ antiporter subunit D